ncbi:MAG: hypothetical protein AB8E82_01700 [Aureispira sp.]
MIKNHKRKSLQKLYKVLKKTHIPDKESLFERVFEAPYKEKKDAILRNELRLLSNAIELFLVQQQQLASINLQQYATKLNLLNIYMERQQWSFFEQLWHRLYKTAVQEHHYEQQIELNQLWVQRKMLQGENSVDAFEALKKHLAQSQLALHAHFQEQYQRLQLKYGFVERNLYALNPRYEAQLPPPPSVIPALPNQAVIDYLSLVAESYLLHGNAKIQQLEKALEYQSFLQAQDAYQDLYENTFSIQGNIAIEYFLQKQYTQAHQAYQKLLPQIDSLPKAKKMAILFNYMVNLICLGHYQPALEVYKKNESAFSENTLFKYRSLYFKAWCYILQEDYSQALDLVLACEPQNRPHQDSIYGRILLSILYSMLGELELAERELYNIKQKHQYRALQEPFSMDCAFIFYKLVQVQFLPPSDRKKHKVEKLVQEMHEKYNAEGNTTRSTLMLRWFDQVTARLLAGSRGL